MTAPGVEPGSLGFKYRALRTAPYLLLARRLQEDEDREDDQGDQKMALRNKIQPQVDTIG